jgi:ubiquinone biosynthesis protein
VFRTFAEIEGLLRWLYIDFDVIDHCKGFAEAEIAAAKEPARLVKAAGEEVREWAGVARRLPREVETLIKNMTTGQFSIDLGRQGFDLVVELNRSSNRIAVGLVIAALIIGSSFMLVAEKGPLVWGMTAIGLVVFALGCSLGLMLIWLIVKSGKY